MAHKLEMGRAGLSKAKPREIDRAQEEEPKRGGDSDYTRKPAAQKGGSEVGPERHANIDGGLYGNPAEHNPLRAAGRELYAQHPIHHDDHGPHHHTDHHIRHEPLHGLKVRSGREGPEQGRHGGRVHHRGKK